MIQIECIYIINKSQNRISQKFHFPKFYKIFQNFKFSSFKILQFFKILRIL